MTLKQFCDRYVSTLDVSRSTRKAYAQSVGWACRYFGAGRQLDTITVNDFGEYLEHLLMRLASATAKRYAKRLRGIFHAAAEAGLMTVNPASGFNLYAPAERGLPLVSIETSLRIMDHCPTADWLVLVALTRFAGMRPVEVLDLEWKHVLGDRLKVYSRRGGMRDCPLFAPLAEVLEYAKEIPGASSTHVLAHLRDHSNVTKGLQRLISSAGLPAIDRPFYAFALTRRRELQQRFKFATVNDWLQLDFRRPAESTASDWQTALAMQCDFRAPALPWA